MHAGTHVRPVLAPCFCHRMMQISLLLLLARPAAGWISASQAKYGTQIDEIVKASDGLSRASAFRSLGWLWTYPRDPLDTKGLGGSITWALDPALCDHLLPRMREGFWRQSFVGCPMIKASIQRALNAWAINHAYISFSDVSPLCDEEAKRGGGGLATMGSPAWDNYFAPPLRTSCSHAELYVTVRANQSEPFSDGYDAKFGGDAVSEGVAYPRLTSDFRYTNGETPIMLIGAVVIKRQVVEVVGGRIELDARPSTCYYLDHKFCAPFNAMKRATSPGAAFFGGFFFFFLTWGVPMALIVLEFLLQMALRIRKRWVDMIACKVSKILTQNSVRLIDLFRQWDEDGNGAVDKEEFRKAVLALGYKVPKRFLYAAFDSLDDSGDGLIQYDELSTALSAHAQKGLQSESLKGSVYSYVLLGTVAAWSVAGTTMRIYWCIVPWAFYQFILQNCWECYDFEAAVSHQVGHILGLGHPDEPPDGRVFKPGNNSYNVHLAGGGVMNATNASSHCTHVWDDVVAGTPPGLSGGDLIYMEGGKCDGPCGLVRTALMARYTASHATSGGCLAQDDFEGLMTLYPMCTSGGVPSVPTCLDEPINIGLLLVLTALLAPLLLSMVSAFLIQLVADYRAKLRELREQPNGVDSQSQALVAAASEPADASGADPALMDASGGGGAGGGGLSGLLGGGGGGGNGGGGGGGGSRASRFIAFAKKTQAISPAYDDGASTALVQATISEDAPSRAASTIGGGFSPPEADEAAGAVPTGDGEARALLPARAQRYAAPLEQEQGSAS